MSAVDLKPVEVVEKKSNALPMTAWAANLFGLWPIALVIAYLERGKVSPELAGQYRYMIRTVWIGAVLFIASYVLCAVLIGFVLVLAVMLWWYARCIKAMLALHRDEPLRNPTTWFV